jgi:uncharacterized protein (DUF2236 family)
MGSRSDEGFFGPDSVSWRVHRETTVLFGGARALLLQAAHPLVIAGARATGFYERDPWKRLERTLLLTYTLTFGTKADATAAAERINQVHRRVKGVDPVTGERYDGLDPDLLLWVHAVLVESALRFEALTVGALDEADRQRFHEEQMLAAELLLLPRDRIPPTVADLRAYVREVVAGGDLIVTEAARTVAGLFRDPPAGAEWRPVLRAVSWWAFGTLPEPLRSEYGFRHTRAKAAAMRASLRALKAGRPLIPVRYRHILIAQTAERRVQAFGGAARPAA